MPKQPTATVLTIWQPGATLVANGTDDGTTVTITNVTVTVLTGWVLDYDVNWSGNHVFTGTLNAGNNQYRVPGKGVDLDQLSYSLNSRHA